MPDKLRALFSDKGADDAAELREHHRAERLDQRAHRNAEFQCVRRKQSRFDFNGEDVVL